MVGEIVRRAAEKACCCQGQSIAVVEIVVFVDCARYPGTFDLDEKTSFSGTTSRDAQPLPAC